MWSKNTDVSCSMWLLYICIYEDIYSSKIHYSIVYIGVWTIIVHGVSKTHCIVIFMHANIITFSPQVHSMSNGWKLDLKLPM